MKKYRLKMDIISKIDQKTVIPFIYISIILIGIDVVTTIIGLNLELEENNIVIIYFMNLFGDLYGLIIAMIGKSIMVIISLSIFQHMEKGLDVAFKDISLKNIYWVLYLTFIVMIMMLTLKSDIKNLILIISQFKVI